MGQIAKQFSAKCKIIAFASVFLYFYFVLCIFDVTNCYCIRAIISNYLTRTCAAVHDRLHLNIHQHVFCFFFVRHFRDSNRLDTAALVHWAEHWLTSFLWCALWVRDAEFTYLNLSWHNCVEKYDVSVH